MVIRHSCVRRVGLPLVLAVGLAVPGIPRGAHPQPGGQTRRIGYLATSPRESAPALWHAFLDELRERGWIEGRNVLIEYRHADGKPERFPDLAVELVRLKVDVIVAGGGSPGARAARAATRSIPIVAVGTADLFVANLARPDSNITGVTTLSWDISGKRLELIREAVPGSARIAVLWEQGNLGSARQVQEAQVVARALGVQVHEVGIRSLDEVEGAFETMARQHVDAAVVTPIPWLFTERRRVVDLALKHKLPTLFGPREYAEAGGLMSYGTNLAELVRRVAGYVDKLLRGARPADLPVEQPTKFDLIVNLRTAKALGLTIPPSVLLRADEVIE